MRKINFLLSINRQLKRIPIFIVVFLSGLTSVFAQRTVTGTIEGADGSGSIPGATILIKGTSEGTISDFDGKFSLSVPGDDAVLVISFVGYETKEVLVGSQSSIKVSLNLDVTELEEIVVVGYGVQKKKVVTAATVKVDGEDLMSRNTTRPLQALQGQAAGVNIRTNSGQPGEGMRVNIRGLGTIGNAGPLYVVDGIATGDISYLNNADIESIDVLKDAASAAIYGSRAANGVVLITTKKGSAEKSSISFDAYYGVQNRYRTVEMLSAREYAQIMNEQHINSGGSISGLPFDVNNLPAYTGGANADTRWLDEMFVDNAATQNYSLGLSGGSEQSVYSISLSYTSQAGIVGGKEQSFYDRYNARINLENNYFGGKLKIGENLTYAYTNKNGISVGNQYSNSLRGAFNASPLLPVYDENGEFFNTAGSSLDQFGEPYWNNTEANPYGSMVINNQNDRNDQKLLGNVYLELNPIKNLRIRSSVGMDLYSDEYRSYSPEYQLSIYSQQAYNSVEQNMSRSRAIQYDNYANYDFGFGSHQFSAMVGMSAREYNRSFIKGVNANLVFSDFDKAWLDNATNQEWNLITLEGAPIDDDEENGEEKLLSYFGRVNYNFNERYLFSAIIRADGSSRFAKGNQWGIFPSVSGGWVISEEGFMSGVSTLNFLKLRASWGQNGNQNIPSFQYLAPITFTQATYNFGNEEAVNSPGAYQSRLAYEQLQWETSEQINIGAEMELFSTPLFITLDWYKKSTIDWLIEAPVLGTAGADPPVINGGEVENTGIEFELTYNNSIGDLNYSLAANGAFNKNRVVNIPTEDERIIGGANQLYNNAPDFYVAEAGHPIGYFWGYQTDGIFQNTGEVQAYTSTDGTVIQPTARPGDLRYVDQNDDGRLDDDDRIELGNPNPPVTLGFTFSGNYKNFDFSVMTYGSFGHQIVQSYRGHSGRYANYTTDILDRWTGEGTSTTIPRVTNGNINYIRFSDIFIQDGDFYRIGNLTVAYDFAKLIDIDQLQQVRLYFAVNNLYTFTKYTGMDPDIGYGFDNGVQDRFSSGIDLGFYPNPRTMLVGLNVKF